MSKNELRRSIFRMLFQLDAGKLRCVRQFILHIV